MFSLFRKKSGEKSKEKVQWAQDAAYNVLMTQLDLASASENPQVQRQLLTPYGCGYIFGFADALIQRAGITDDVESMAQLTLVHCRIFGKEHGGKIFGASLGKQQDATFLAGRATGGREALRWLTEQSSIPTGLSDYLRSNSGGAARPGSVT